MLVRDAVAKHLKSGSSAEESRLSPLVDKGDLTLSKLRTLMFPAWGSGQQEAETGQSDEDQEQELVAADWASDSPVNPPARAEAQLGPPERGKGTLPSPARKPTWRLSRL